MNSIKSDAKKTWHPYTVCSSLRCELQITQNHIIGLFCQTILTLQFDSFKNNKTNGRITNTYSSIYVPYSTIL